MLLLLVAVYWFHHRWYYYCWACHGHDCYHHCYFSMLQSTRFSYRVCHCPAYHLLSKHGILCQNSHCLSTDGDTFWRARGLTWCKCVWIFLYSIYLERRPKRDLTLHLWPFIFIHFLIKTFHRVGFKVLLMTKRVVKVIQVRLK